MLVIVRTEGCNHARPTPTGNRFDYGRIGLVSRTRSGNRLWKTLPIPLQVTVTVTCNAFLGGAVLRMIDQHDIRRERLSLWCKARSSMRRIWHPAD